MTDEHCDLLTAVFRSNACGDGSTLDVSRRYRRLRKSRWTWISEHRAWEDLKEWGYMSAGHGRVWLLLKGTVAISNAADK